MRSATPGALVLAVAVLLGMAACIGGPSPATKHYVLSPVITALPDEATSPAAPLVIGVGPVSLPAYLDRPQMVIRPASDRIEINEFEQWCEPRRHVPVAEPRRDLLPDRPRHRSNGRPRRGRYRARCALARARSVRERG